MAYEAFGIQLDDYGYPAHHIAAKDRWLNSTNEPPPLHSWAEYHRAKEWLKLGNTIMTCQKLDKYQIKEWQDETWRVAKWEDDHFNHL